MTHDSDREFEDLYRVVVAQATRHAELYGAGADATDVAQRVGVDFWNAWKARPEAFRDDPRGIRGWVAKATRRNILDVRDTDAARTAREMEVGSEVHPPAPSWMQPHDALEAGELQRIVAEALARMPALRRETWLCIREGGESYDSLAARRGVSRDAIKYHVVAANAELRAAVAPFLAGLPAQRPARATNTQQRREVQ